MFRWAQSFSFQLQIFPSHIAWDSIQWNFMYRNSIVLVFLWCIRHIHLNYKCKLLCITIETKCKQQTLAVRTIDLCMKILSSNIARARLCLCVCVCWCAEYSAVDFIYFSSSSSFFSFVSRSISIHCFAFSQKHNVPLNMTTAQILAQIFT